MISKIASLIGFSSTAATAVMLLMKALGNTGLGYVIVFLPVIITTSTGIFLLSLARVLDSFAGDE